MKAVHTHYASYVRKVAAAVLTMLVSLPLCSLALLESTYMSCAAGSGENREILAVKMGHVRHQAKVDSASPAHPSPETA